MATLFASGWGQVALMFASWCVVTGGIWKLFERAERIIRPERKQLTADWLEHADIEQPFRRVAEGFVHAFDAVFGSKHLSWRCFFRSCVASYVITLVMFLLWTALAPGRFYSFINDLKDSLTFILLITGVVNVIPDYLCLLKTRYVIGIMRRASPGGISILAAVDAVGSVAISFVAFAVIALIPVVLDPSNNQAGENLGVATDLFLIGWKFGDGPDFFFGGWPSPGIWTYTTLLGSAWAWLYIAAGLMLRVTPTIGWLWRLITSWVDVPNQPFMALGAVSILIVTTLYLLAVPFVVL